MLLRHEGRIIDWIFANPEATLPECAHSLGLGEQQVRELVGSEAFLRAFRQRLLAESMAGRGNTLCPRCRGRSARISCGFPDFKWHGARASGELKRSI